MRAIFSLTLRAPFPITRCLFTRDFVRVVLQVGVLAADDDGEVYQRLRGEPGQARSGGPNKLQGRGNPREVPPEAERW